MPYKKTEKQREYQRNGLAKKRKKIKADLLNGQCCIDCGNDDIRVLEFHHRDPDSKRFTVMSVVTYSKENMETEIAKCDLLCANCHLIRHGEEREERPVSAHSYKV